MDKKSEGFNNRNISKEIYHVVKDFQNISRERMQDVWEEVPKNLQSKKKDLERVGAMLTVELRNKSKNLERDINDDGSLLNIEALDLLGFNENNPLEELHDDLKNYLEVTSNVLGVKKKNKKLIYLKLLIQMNH